VASRHDLEEQIDNDLSCCGCAIFAWGLLAFALSSPILKVLDLYDKGEEVFFAIFFGVPVVLVGLLVLVVRPGWIRLS
jgi:hypothetical protein